MEIKTMRQSLSLSLSLSLSKTKTKTKTKRDKGRELLNDREKWEMITAPSFIIDVTLVMIKRCKASASLYI